VNAPPESISVNDFAKAVIGGCGLKVIAMLFAYFDESGTSDHEDVALIGGAIADLAFWDQLEAPWKKILRSFGINTYHATDCENRRGEFEPFERPIRDAITAGLAIELAKVPLQGFGSGVYREDFKFCPAEIRKNCQDDPMLMCFELCMQQVSSWSRQYAGSEPVNLVFAKHQKYQRHDQEIHAKYLSRAETWGRGIGSIAFADPAQLVQLQAADLLSYESFRFACEQRKGKPSNTANRPVWKYISEGERPISLMLHDLESLQKLKFRKG
jgi:Protein of unknown function (DUF3800)